MPELAQAVAKWCLELGMPTSLVRGGYGIFRLAPPLTMNDAEMDLALTLFAQAIRESLQ